MNYRLTTIHKMLTDYVKLLTREAEYLRGQLNNSPVGTLRISHSRGKVRYYHRESSDSRSGKYISDEQLVRNLAQKDYHKRLLDELNKEISTISAAIKACAEDPSDKVTSLLSSQRCGLITPVHCELTDDEYAARWLSTPYRSKLFYKFDQEHYTLKGLRVRSKSEVQLVNCLDEMKVPYRYEQELTLGGITIYPDITCLNKRTRKSYIWEHFGMMDNVEYSRKAIERIELYRKHGYYLGTDLITTYETQTAPLNTMAIKDIIRKYLL